MDEGIKDRNAKQEIKVKEEIQKIRLQTLPVPLPRLSPVGVPVTYEQHDCGFSLIELREM